MPEPLILTWPATRQAAEYRVQVLVHTTGEVVHTDLPLAPDGET